MARQPVKQFRVGSKAEGDDFDKAEIEALKECCGCKVPKLLREFHRATATTDGRNAACKTCAGGYSRKSYRDNRTKMIAAAQERKDRTRREHRRKVWAILQASGGCADCGETDPVVLEFDHVRGTKQGAVATMISNTWSWSKIEAEIAKCEVRCANCHRRKTARDLNFYQGVA